MARITVEDCVTQVPNRFDLVLVAAHRAKQIASGAPILVDRDNDKNPVVALREIAEGHVNADDMYSSLVNLHRIYARPSMSDDDADNYADQESSDNAEIDAMFAQNQLLGLSEVTQDHDQSVNFIGETEVSDDLENGHDVLSERDKSISLDTMMEDEQHSSSHDVHNLSDDDDINDHEAENYDPDSDDNILVEKDSYNDQDADIVE